MTIRYMNSFATLACIISANYGIFLNSKSPKQSNKDLETGTKNSSGRDVLSVTCLRLTDSFQNYKDKDPNLI